MKNNCIHQYSKGLKELYLTATIEPSCFILQYFDPFKQFTRRIFFRPSRPHGYIRFYFYITASHDLERGPVKT